MSLRARFSSFAILIAILASSSYVTSQSSGVSKKAATPKLSSSQSAALQADKKGKTTAPDKASATIATKISEAIDQLPSPGADYIPCRFTYAELSSLTTPDAVLTLSPNTAEALVQKVTAAIVQQQVAGR